MLGVMSTEEALEKGEELGLDLVIASPKPTSRGEVYGLFQVQIRKREERPREETTGEIDASGVERSENAI